MRQEPISKIEMIVTPRSPAMKTNLILTIIMLTAGLKSFAKSNPWNEVKTVLSKDDIVLGLPFKAKTALTMYIGNRDHNVGKIVRLKAATNTQFKFGDLVFASPITVSVGKPSVFISAFNIGDSDVYHHAMKSDLDHVVQLTGELARDAQIGNLKLKAANTTSLFCSLYQVKGACAIDVLNNWHVVQGTLAEAVAIGPIDLQVNDEVFFQPLSKKNQLFAFQSHATFRELELDHENIDIQATVLARGAIFDKKGQTTAIYTKAGERVLGIPLEERYTFGAASIEIHPSGNIHLSPQVGASTLIDGIPLGVGERKTFARLKFSPSGKLIEGLTHGDFTKAGILFRDETLVKRDNNQYQIQVSYGGAVYEGTWKGEQMFLHEPIFTISSQDKLLDVSCESSLSGSECNHINDKNYVQSMKDSNRVLPFSL